MTLYESFLSYVPLGSLEWGGAGSSGGLVRHPAFFLICVSGGSYNCLNIVIFMFLGWYVLLPTILMHCAWNYGQK